MTRRLFALLAVTAFTATWAAPAFAADEPNVMKGTVQSVKGNNLVVINKDGDKKPHTFAVPQTAKVTVDGKNAKLADLKAGQSVKVTTQKKDKGFVVVSVEADK
jgi:hypothetical protein